MARGKSPRKRLDLRAPKKRSRRARKTPLRKRPSLVEAFRAADQAARYRSNRRIQRRRGGRTIQASLDIPLAEIGKIDFDDDEDYALNLPTRILRFIIGLLLIPLCAVTLITLFQRVSVEGFALQFWHTPQFFYFAIGCILCTAWLLSGIFRKMWLYLYVLGHELTHVIFIFCSLGKVSGFSVGLDGGYVITNKTNILIALSPYFVPFWSLVGLLILAPINHFYPDLTFYVPILFATIGVTWTFHLLFTCWMIPRDQPDLRENETFFSLMLIILANIILLSWLLCFADPNLHLLEHFVYHWINNFLDLFVEPFHQLPAESFL